MYSNGSFNPSPGNGLPPPPVQQAYMYPPPPPPASSAPQAQLITMPGTSQSYTNPSYFYPSSQGETARGTSQQFRCNLPPVSMLPPPPPLPPGTMPPGQPSFPLSFPIRKLETPGRPLPPPPPRSSLPLVADPDFDKLEAAKLVCESVSLNGIALDHEGPAVEDAGSSKESSIHCGESSPPLDKAEDGSLLCTDPDIEMEGMCEKNLKLLLCPTPKFGSFLLTHLLYLSSFIFR